MGIFGWSYPPGAAGDPYAPYNQTGSIELTDRLPDLDPNIQLFWVDDQHLVAELYDEHAPYGKGGRLDLGRFDWDDALSDDANEQAAAMTAAARLEKIK